MASNKVKSTLQYFLGVIVEKEASKWFRSCEVGRVTLANKLRPMSEAALAHLMSYRANDLLV